MNSFCSGAKFVSFGLPSTPRSVVTGNSDPREHPHDKFLMGLPIGTLLTITEILDPETCECTPACGLFLKCSAPSHCNGAVWCPIKEISPAEEGEPKECEKEEVELVCCEDDEKTDETKKTEEFETDETDEVEI